MTGTGTRDETAAAAVGRHHAQMAAALAERAERLVAAAALADREAARAATVDLSSWCRTELVPHALAEERSLYLPAQQRPEGRLLVEGMLAEHRSIVRLVEALDPAAEPVRSAATGTAVRELFASHLAKEDELVLPLLLADPDVSVADLLAGLHELLGEEG